MHKRKLMQVEGVSSSRKARERQGLRAFTEYGCSDWIMEFKLAEQSSGASLVAQLVKNLPAMQEMQVWSLGWEETLEKGKATHSSIPAWRIPWTEEPGGL